MRPNQPKRDGPSDRDNVERAFEIARRLLLQDFADAGRQLVNGLGDESCPWNWDENSLSGQVENRRLFEDRRQNWLDTIKNAIAIRFGQMRSLYHELEGTLASETDKRVAETIRALLPEQCDFENLLRNVPVFTVTGDLFLPPGITEDAGLLCDTTKGLLEVHLNHVADESLLGHCLQAAEMIPLADVGSTADTSTSEEGQCRNRFERKGKVWSVVYGEESVQLPDQLGLRYVAVILANAGRPIAVTELVAVRLPKAAPRFTEEPDSIPISDGGLHQKRSDPHALREYKNRVSHLDSEIAAAESRNDLGAAERFRDERNQIADHLISEQGLRGKARDFSDDVEKARDSARRAIDRALLSIQGASPKTAAHLRLYIEKGVELIYRDSTTSWKVSQT